MKRVFLKKQLTAVETKFPHIHLKHSWNLVVRGLRMLFFYSCSIQGEFRCGNSGKKMPKMRVFCKLICLITSFTMLNFVEFKAFFAVFKQTVLISKEEIFQNSQIVIIIINRFYTLENLFLQR